MDFGGINYLAILVAAIAAFMTGGVYYGIMAKPWMKAVRLSEDQTKMGPKLFITTFICELVLAFMIAGVIGHLGDGQITLNNGVISGFFLWLGIIMPTMTINHRYQTFGWNLTIIDGAHWLLVSLAIGAVIGLFGP